MGAIGAVTSLGPVQYDAIKDQRFQDFMHNPDNKFDLLIVGYFFSDYQIGLGRHFKCPIVISWMSASNLFVNKYIGNPPEAAYVPISPMFGQPDPLTFTGRLTNFIIGLTSLSFTSVIDHQINGFYK